MTCAEVQQRLERFVDGELRGRAMRLVARHLAACPGCERAAGGLDRLHDAVRQSVGSRLVEPDLEAAWARMAPQLQGPGEPPRLEAAGLGPWVRSRFPLTWMTPRVSPVWGAVATAAALAAFFLFTGDRGSGPPNPTSPAQIARIDRLDTSNVRVWNEDTGALVIWVDTDDVALEPVDW